MLFRRKRKERKDEFLHKELFLKLDGRKVKYVSLRKGAESGETILGKDGLINIIDGNEIAILCNNKIVFRHPIDDTLRVDELMSLAGVNFRYKDKDIGENLTVTAYYKYHRK